MEHYLHTRDEALAALCSSRDGLTPEQAAERLESCGRNTALRAPVRMYELSAMRRALVPAMPAMLLLAVLCAVRKEYSDAAIIAAITALATWLSVYQSLRFRKRAQAREARLIRRAAVRRGGVILQIDAELIVPGDIVLIKAGDAVPADLRLIESSGLITDESALAGVQATRSKDARALGLEGEVDAVGRTNMVHTGTYVIYGRGEGVAVATGMNTEHERVSAVKPAHKRDLLAPVQHRLERELKRIEYGVLVVCVLIFAAASFRGGTGWAVEALSVSLGLIAAALPCALPVIASAVLGVSAERMGGGGVIVRSAEAAETLGRTDIVCIGMSAAAALNELKVCDIYGDENLLATVFYLCNNAQRATDGSFIGDAVDVVLKEFARQKGITPQSPRVGEAPFDSNRRMMSTVHEAAGGVLRQYTKGALDEVLERCTGIFWQGKVEILTDVLRERVVEECCQIAGQRQLVLGAAWRDYVDAPYEYSPEELEMGMTFIGFAGLDVQQRAEIADTVAAAERAGARTILVTGAHPDTACAMAESLGLFAGGGRVVTGAALDSLADSELCARVEDISVFAAVSPAQKARIVQAYQSRGHVVAFAGGAPEDVAALRATDVGMASHQQSSGLICAAADIVLTGGSFASAVEAAGHSRLAFENIRKAVCLLLAVNLVELTLVFIASLGDFWLISNVQMLLISLFSDVLLAGVLISGWSPKAAPRPSQSPGHSFYSGGLGFDIVCRGALIAVAALCAYIFGGAAAAFVTLALSEALCALDIDGLRQNRAALCAAAMTVLVIGAVCIPALSAALGLEALELRELGLSAALALLVPAAGAAIRAAKKVLG